MANPAGIQVDGAGFINASGVTLTTGTPVVNAGNLESFRVTGGRVNVEGLGLDTRDADYTAILTRAMQVNASIWAKELKVATGANEVRATSASAAGTLQTTAIAGTGEKPAFALDVAALGGMYAGKIYLIGTEAGLGVNNAGQIGSTGDLVLLNNGQLVNRNTIQAQGHVSVQAAGIDNAGGAMASLGQGLSIDSRGGALNNALGQVWSGKTLTIDAGDLDNGLDWRSYGAVDLERARSHFHFLGKAAWRVKNVQGAIDVARVAGERLAVLGGSRFDFRRGLRLTLSPSIRFHGMVGGAEKSRLLSASRGLVFPVVWHEPFGLAVIESLYFGCPVFATPYGALPELVPPECGALSSSCSELADMLKSDSFDRRACHAHAVHFNALRMAADYVQLYERVLAGEMLNNRSPVGRTSKNLPWTG